MTTRSRARRTRAAAILGLTLLAGTQLACSDDGNGEVPPREDQSTTSTTAASYAGGWAPTVTVGAPGSPNELLLVGGYRVNDEKHYEARTDSFLMGRDGALRAITRPPVKGDIGSGQGTVVDGVAYLSLNTCSVGGDPDGAGFGCIPDTIKGRFLRYDLDADTWTELTPPPPGATLAPAKPIPGQSEPGGPIYFGLAGSLGGDIFDNVVAYAPAAHSWSRVLQREGGLPVMCTSGGQLYAFDGQGLLREFARLKDEQASGTQAIHATFRTITVDGSETTEPVVLRYPVEAGLDLVNVLGIRPWCMRDGAVLVGVAPGHATPDTRWELRTRPGEWTEVEPDALLDQNAQFEAIALPHAVVFAASSGTDASASGGPRPTVYLSVTDHRWHRLEDRPGTNWRHAIHAGGPSLIFTTPIFGDPTDGFTTIEIP